uniref:Uncharacterized protein n=1 Tax=Anopheles quadriannulatus TaxID=34691 RepID=A0A182XR04_ANOQN
VAVGGPWPKSKEIFRRSCYVATVLTVLFGQQCRRLQTTNHDAS